MNYKKITMIVLLINILLLSGCALFQRGASFKTEPWRVRREKLQQVTDWSIKGAFSITYNKKRDMARFNWTQNKDNYEINIFGPLNIKSVKIIGDSEGVELWRNNKRCTKVKTSEQLVYEQFGWRLPISNIRHWILSLPAPTKITSKNYDQYGHLIYLVQDGWEVQFKDFQIIPNQNIELPKTVELTNQGVTIKIKVTDRNFGIK